MLSDSLFSVYMRNNHEEIAQLRHQKQAGSHRHIVSLVHRVFKETSNDFFRSAK